MVDLPAPVGPTSANVSPAAMVRSTCSSTSAFGLYPNVTFWSVISPSIGRQLTRVGLLPHRRVGGEEVAELEHTGAALLVGVVELRELLDRREQAGEVEAERGEVAVAQRAVEHHVPADQHDHRLREHADELRTRAVDAADVRGVEVGLAVLADDVGVLHPVVRLAVVRRDHPRARQVLLEIGHQVGDPVAHREIAVVGLRAEPDGEQRHRGHDAQDDVERERGVHREHLPDDHGQRADLEPHVDEALLEQHLDGFDVARGAGHDATRLLVREVVEREPLDVAEHAVAEAVEHVLADAARPRGADRADDGGRHQQPHVDQRELPHDREVGGRTRRRRVDALVDGVGDEARPVLEREGLERDEDEHAEDRPTLGPEQRAEGERLLVLVDDLRERDVLRARSRARARAAPGPARASPEGRRRTAYRARCPTPLPARSGAAPSSARRRTLPLRPTSVDPPGWEIGHADRAAAPRRCPPTRHVRAPRCARGAPAPAPLLPPARACPRTPLRRGRGSRGRAGTSRMRSSWRPSATMRPPSSTTTRSARLIVESRWAMMSVVRPRISVRSAPWISNSRCASTALVASSSMRIRGLTSSVRAIAMRWRCPPDSVYPRSPITVS